MPATTAPWDKTRILAILAEPTASAFNRLATTKMLLAMYARQTESERSTETTNEHNGVGFNGTDATFLSSVAAKARYGLSDKQLLAVAKCLKKYSRQLVEIAAAKSGGL